MKRLKIILVAALIALLATTAWAVIFPTIKQAITSAGYVAVRLPAGSGCSSFSLWTEDGNAYYISSKEDGSDGILVTSNGSNNFPLSMAQVHRTDSAGAVLCYVKGTSSTNIVGLILK